MCTKEMEDYSPDASMTNRVGEASVEQPILMTTSEVAQVLRCSRSHVYALLAKGHLPRVQLGPGSVRVHREALEALLRQQASASVSKRS